VPTRSGDVDPPLAPSRARPRGRPSAPAASRSRVRTGRSGGARKTRSARPVAFVRDRRRRFFPAISTFRLPFVRGGVARSRKRVARTRGDGPTTAPRGLRPAAAIVCFAATSATLSADALYGARASGGSEMRRRPRRAPVGALRHPCALLRARRACPHAHSRGRASRATLRWRAPRA
jgi:hypothetical protein